MHKPMLAHSFDKYAHKIEYQCAAQRKLDGMRCIAVREGNEIKYFSRALKPVNTVHHLDARLLEAMRDGDVFDGELFTPGVDFQKLISWVKREQEDTPKVEYHVYDMYSDEPFSERMSYLQSVLDHTGPVVLVDTEECRSEEQLDEIHERYVAEGYEGTMVRNIDSAYKYGKRSFDLLKRKDFVDEEYEIVSVVEGKGKFRECAVFICQAGKKTFAVTSPGKVEDKQRFWEERNEMIGKLVTVKFQEKTNAGVPRFPVAVSIRDYE